MRFYLSFILLLSTMGLSAQQVDNLKVNFKIKNIGTYAKGSFSETSIEGQFDKNQLTTSFLRARIAVKSVDTGIAKRDKHLLEADYFDQTTYPHIIFISDRIVQRSEQLFTAHGTLEIKGTKRKTSLDLTLIQQSGKTLARSKFEIRRKDFGVGSKSWILSDRVKAEIQFRVQ